MFFAEKIHLGNARMTRKLSHSAAFCGDAATESVSIMIRSEGVERHKKLLCKYEVALGRKGEPRQQFRFVFAESCNVENHGREICIQYFGQQLFRHQVFRGLCPKPVTCA